VRPEASQFFELVAELRNQVEASDQAFLDNIIRIEPKRYGCLGEEGKYLLPYLTEKLFAEHEA